MSTSKNKSLIKGVAAIGTMAITAVLTLLIFAMTPIFSLTEGPDATDASREGLLIYRKAWKTTEQNFVFTQKLKDWSKWKHKYDSQITSKADGIMYAKEMVESLKDPYTCVLDEEQTKAEVDQIKGTLAGVGIQFEAAHDANGNLIVTNDWQQIPNTDANKQPIIHRVIRQSPASGAGLQDGDAIVSINGKSAVGMTMDQLTVTIRGQAGTIVTFEIQREAKLLSIPITRRTFDLEPVTYRMLADNLGYIRIDSFLSRNTAAECLQALKALKHCRGYVLDLRSNTGGLVNNAKDVMALFEEKGVVFEVRQRANGRTTTDKIMIDDSMPHLAAKKPLVVLVNSGTASASEMVAGALHDNRHVKLIGTQTFGKGLMQTIFAITDDVLLHVTMAQWLTPNGTCPGSAPKTQHPNGLMPDVTIATGPYFVINSDRDNQLKRGIMVLKQELDNAK